MRLTPLTLALTLPAGVALAQSLENCPGGDLSECTVDANPPVVQRLQEGSLSGNPTTDSDSQATEAAPTSGTGENIQVGSTLSGIYPRVPDPSETGLQLDDSSVYYDTGSSYVRVDSDSGEVLEVQERSRAGGSADIDADQYGGSNVFSDDGPLVDEFQTEDLGVPAEGVRGDGDGTGLNDGSGLDPLNRDPLGGDSLGAEGGEPGAVGGEATGTFGTENIGGSTGPLSGGDAGGPLSGGSSSGGLSGGTSGGGLSD